MSKPAHRWSRHLIGGLVFWFGMVAGAQGQVGGGPKSYDPSERGQAVSTDEEIWKEGEAPFPDPPDETDLITFTSLSFETPYQYLLDRKSLAMGEDKIFRYTILVRTDDGAVNVLYEGIRCESKEYKTYAYLSGEEFHPSSAPQWKPIVRSGGTEYRGALYEEVVCMDPKSPTPMSEILTHLVEQDENGKRTVPLSRRSAEFKVKD